MNKINLIGIIIIIFLVAIYIFISIKPQKQKYNESIAIPSVITSTGKLFKSKISSTNKSISVRLTNDSATAEITVPIDNPVLTDKDNQLIFKNKDSSQEIKYVKIKNGLKEEITLYQKPKSNLFIINMSLDGVYIRKNIDGNPAFLMPGVNIYIILKGRLSLIIKALN